MYREFRLKPKKLDVYIVKRFLLTFFIAGEMFAAMIASEHNLAFYLDLVRVARQHIEAGDFVAWKNSVADTLKTRL